MKAAVVALGLLAAVVAGCTEGGRRSTLPRFPNELSPDEKAAFAARLERDLAAARRRKARIVAANRRALDSLPRLPGTELLDERQNSEHVTGPEGTRAEEEYALYAEVSLPVQASLDVQATGWGTFREYADPPGAGPQRVYDHFEGTGNGWRVAGWGATTGGGGREIFSLSLWRSGRCFWFHIGTVTGAELRKEVAPGRSYEVATDLSDYSSCYDAGRL